MNRIGLLCLIVLLALAGAVLAQETPESETNETATITSKVVPGSGDYMRFEAPEHGFALELPDSGRIITPQDEGWEGEKESVFRWEGSGGEPITMIWGRVDSFEAPIDKLSFDIICGTALESWEDDPAKFEIVTSNEKLVIEGQEWRLIEIADSSHGDGQMIYYSIFCTYHENSFFTVMMYYREPVNDTIREYGIPIIYSFDLI
ncbi:hypothetical protein JW859_04565 [bacterium]|nr:hypothetical protein [bacterium]